MLAVDQLSVNFDIKNAAFTFNKPGIGAGFAFDCGRQTGGLRCVVSHDTVSDCDVHEFAFDVIALKHREAISFDTDTNAVLGC